MNKVTGLRIESWLCQQNFNISPLLSHTSCDPDGSPNVPSLCLFPDCLGLGICSLVNFLYFSFHSPHPLIRKASDFIHTTKEKTIRKVAVQTICRQKIFNHEITVIAILRTVPQRRRPPRLDTPNISIQVILTCCQFI